MPYTEDGKNDDLFSWEGSEYYLISKYDLDKKYPYGNKLLTVVFS